LEYLRHRKALRVDPRVEARSWYEATADGFAEGRRLDSAVDCDVAIVGAGMTGLNAALELAIRGFDVAVLEAKRVGFGASGRNGGQVVTGFSKALSDVQRLVGKEDTKHLWAMAEEGKRILKERIVTYAIDCDYVPGYMYTAVKPSHVNGLREMLEGWQAMGYRGARWLGQDETRALVDCPHYLGGIQDDENGHLHPLRYTVGLARAAVRAGAAIYEGATVLRIEEAASKVVLKTDKGMVTARHVLLCGNALLGPISRQVAQEVNAQIIPVSTYIIATEQMSSERAEAIIPGNIAVSDVMFVVNYYRRTRDNRILFGGGLDWSGPAHSNVGRRLERAMRYWLPRTVGLRTEYCWGGLIDLTRNMLPSLGRLSPNVFYVHGFSGNGLSLTGIAGRVAAEAVAGTAERFDVFARMPKFPFPGGAALRQPLAVAGALWYKLKDMLP
jgi:gamma-glutamylputrescine oxidase